MTLGHLVRAYGEDLESFQRRRSRLFQWTIPFLDRAARFSQLAAHGSRGGSQRIQYLLFIDCLNLLPGERCSVLTGDCLERDDIDFPQARDRAVDGGRGSFTYADFVRDL